jgi:hypothetical protein
MLAFEVHFVLLPLLIWNRATAAFGESLLFWLLTTYVTMV